MSKHPITPCGRAISAINSSMGNMFAKISFNLIGFEKLNKLFENQLFCKINLATPQNFNWIF